MSSPLTSPTRYGVVPDEKPIQRLATPENLNSRLGQVPQTQGDQINLKLPSAPKDPHDITLTPDTTPYSSAVATAKFGDVGISFRGQGDSVNIDASQPPTFSPE